MIEESRLMTVRSDRVLSKSLLTDDMPWEMSDPVPGCEIIGTMEVYRGIWITIAITDTGSYTLYRSMDRIVNTPVHEHQTEIYGMWYIDHGKAIFCATDGWWMTTDAGANWYQIALADVVTTCIAIIRRSDETFTLIAYTAKKIYRCSHSLTVFDEPLVWAEVLDTSTMFVGKWYPAMAGGPLAIVIGAGDKLIRSTECGDIGSWVVMTTVIGTVKNITISDQARLPTFLIEVEREAVSMYHWSYDLCDSIVLDISRFGSNAVVSSVTPTGSGENDSIFAVVGRRMPGSAAMCRLTRRVG